VSGGPGDVGEPDSESEVDCEVRFLHPFQARKTYLCPGCQQEIPPGLGHLVIVPRDQPADRRHWHRACWQHRGRRRPGH
jgi:hypothetical protein